MGITMNVVIETFRLRELLRGRTIVEKCAQDRRKKHNSTNVTWGYL